MPFSFASPSTASLRRLTKTAEAPQSAVQPIASSSATSVSSSEQGIAEQATAGFGEEQDGTGSDKIGRKERPVGKGEGEEKRMKEEEITLKRVLVVDDERVNRKIVRLVLRLIEFQLDLIAFVVTLLCSILVF